MSKRIILTDRDLELIEAALKSLLERSDWLPTTYPERGLAARQRFSELMDKLKIEPLIQKASASSIKGNISQKTKPAKEQGGQL